MLDLLISPTDGSPGCFDVSFDGERLVKGSRDPEHAAARVLLGRGFSGPFSTVDKRGMVRMTFRSIEAAAGVSVIDDDKTGLRVRAYNPFPGDRSARELIFATEPVSQPMTGQKTAVAADRVMPELVP